MDEEGLVTGSAGLSALAADPVLAGAAAMVLLDAGKGPLDSSRILKELAGVYLANRCDRDVCSQIARVAATCGRSSYLQFLRYLLTDTGVCAESAKLDEESLVRYATGHEWSHPACGVLADIVEVHLRGIVEGGPLTRAAYTELMVMQGTLDVLLRHSRHGSLSTTASAVHAALIEASIRLEA